MSWLFRSYYGYSSYRRDPATDAITGWIALALGLGALVYALMAYTDDRHFDAVAQPATGTVVSYASHWHSSRYNSYTYYNPVIDYTINGIAYERECGDGEPRQPGSTGVPARILYDPARPGHIRLNVPGQSADSASFPLAVGVILLVVGAANLGSSRLGPTTLQQASYDGMNQSTWQTDDGDQAYGYQQQGSSLKQPALEENRPRYLGLHAPAQTPDSPDWDQPAADSGISAQEAAQAAREISDPAYWRNLDR